MAVVSPQRSKREQARMALEISVATVIVTIMVGVIGPIVLAILVGKIWGH